MKLIGIFAVVFFLSLSAFATSITNLPLCKKSQTFQVDDVYQGKYDFYTQQGNSEFRMELQGGLVVGPNGITDVPTQVYQVGSRNHPEAKTRTYDPKEFCVKHKSEVEEDGTVKVIAEIKMIHQFTKWGFVHSTEKYAFKHKLGNTPQIGLGGNSFGFIFYVIPLGAGGGTGYSDAYKLRE